MTHKTSFLLATAALLVSACATSPAQTTAQCAAPRLVPSDLRVGDGALDRGFIGGISLGDIDGDNDLDIIATRGYDTSPENRPFRFDRTMVYLNDGAGHFSHDLENPISNADNADSGATLGDIDHDGDLDVFVSGQVGRPDRFYRNLGAGRFAREELGEATATAGGNFSSSWADIDLDGDLDLLVGGPTLEPGEPNLVYRNDNGAFVRVTDTPLENGSGNPGAVLWADFDNDGDQDLFVANSDLLRLNDMTPGTYEASQLYRNEGGWRFTRMLGQAFDNLAYPAMGAAIGDIDNDGDLDLFLHAQPGGDLPGGKRSMPDRLFRNDGLGVFTLDPAFTGPEHEDIAAGAALTDVDSDGDLDLVFASYNTGIFLYANDGAGAFTPVLDPALNERVATYAGFAAGDIDGDGDHDVVAGNWGDVHGGQFATVLTNESTPCGRPLRLDLRDRYGAPDPIGARVTLVTRGPDGERRQLREAMGQTGFRGQSASTFLYAVPNGERIVRAEIRWPNGRAQVVRELEFDRANTIQETP